MIENSPTVTLHNDFIDNDDDPQYINAPETQNASRENRHFDNSRLQQNQTDTKDLNNNELNINIKPNIPEQSEKIQAEKEINQHLETTNQPFTNNVTTSNQPNYIAQVIPSIKNLDNSETIMTQNNIHQIESFNNPKIAQVIIDPNIQLNTYQQKYIEKVEPTYIQQPFIQPQIKQMQGMPIQQQIHIFQPIYNVQPIPQNAVYYQPKLIPAPQKNYIMIKSENPQPVRYNDSINPPPIAPRPASVAPTHTSIPLPPVITNPNQQPTIPDKLSSHNSSDSLLSIPTIPTNNRKQNVLAAPEPIYLDDPNGGKYGIRCVCKKGNPDGFLVQCDMCNFWLHGHCVCVARSTPDPYICPFCLNPVIRCKCNQNNRYDVPIVQCQKCKYWVHKSCQDLLFGIVPKTFICQRCGGREYLLPHIALKENMIPNRTSFVECNRFEILQSIPPGKFHDMVMADLSKTELTLHQTIGKYFQEFATIFFDDNHEFWRTFVDVFTQILNCDKSMVMLAIDAFAYSLLYKDAPRPRYSNFPSKFNMSEGMLPMIDSLNPKRFEKAPTPVSLYVDQENHVRTSETLDDDQFIADLPGFLMFADEMNADDGIPPTCYEITDTSYVIDMEGSSFILAHQFQRSFHFNTVVKIYRLGDEPRVGLFATRLQGPISEEKGKRGPAIQHDMPLILPFDGDIPFNTPKVEWKEKKNKMRQNNKTKPATTPASTTTSSRKSNSTSRGHGNSQSNSRRKGTSDHSQEFPVTLSLLSGFCEDIVPSIPITLLTEKEYAEKHKHEEHVKTRGRNHRIRHFSDEE